MTQNKKYWSQEVVNKLRHKTIYDTELDEYLYDFSDALLQTECRLNIANLMGGGVGNIPLYDRWVNVNQRTQDAINNIRPKDIPETLYRINRLLTQYSRCLNLRDTYYDKTTIAGAVKIGDTPKIVEEIKEPTRTNKEWFKVLKLVRETCDMWQKWQANPNILPDAYLIKVFKRLTKCGFMSGMQGQFVRMYKGERLTDDMKMKLSWTAPNERNKISYNYKSLVELLEMLCGATSLEMREMFPKYFNVKEYRDSYKRNGYADSIHYKKLFEIVNLEN
ncbi:MAG: hypothetical protein SNH27_07325 [Rikenellaceae bacterium]